jgi:leucine-rich repeat-containing protein 49
MHQHQKQFANNLNYLNFNNDNVPIMHRPSSEMQKREQINAKLTSTHQPQSLNSLHINHLNLDSHANGSVRLNVRNKSAYSNSDYVHSQQQLQQQNSAFYQLNNSQINIQSLKQPTSLTKNFIDFSLLQYQQQQQQQQQQQSQQSSPCQFNSETLPRKRTTSNRLQSGSNFKLVNESNKFLEDILAHSKRSLKQTGALQTHQNAPTSPPSQMVSSASSVASSIQLPPSCIVINRTLDEKILFPDKLILERRNLTSCPVIEGEDDLKLINYQHNQIKQINNLDQMKSLIFLDLYDNRIEKMSSISSLLNLRVLMLGKNRIEKIESLKELVFLDILDLHGNEITKVENLNHLRELRVLNLAANQIKCVENIRGLDSLVELNLRRNQIDDINELEYCPKLQRLFLSYNEITSLANIKNFNAISNIQELALDNNPLSSERNYKRNIIGQLLTLKKLDSKRLTDEEKRVAEKLFLKEEYKRRETENLAFLEKKRKMTIKDAENEWVSQQQSKKIEGADSGFNSSTNKSENSDYVEVNANNTNKNASSSNECYQNYLQQFQTNNSVNEQNSKLINAKLKVSTSNLKKATNSLSSSSSSSSSSILSESNEKESEFIGKDDVLKSTDDFNYVHGNFAEQRGKTAIGSSETSGHLVNNRSNSATCLLQRVNKVTTQQQQQQQVEAVNVKKSVTLNGGSNVHEENVMFFYGVKSLEILDIKLDPATVSQVFTVSFHYVDFDEHLCRNFAKIRNKFANVNNVIFTCCNIRVLNQLDCLTEWKRLESLTINKEDNPIYAISVWRQYALNRLSCLQLKKINNQMITLDDLRSSTELFAHLSNWALELPEYKLLAILGQDKKKVIKLAKETSISKAQSAEQIVARDTVIKAVLALNQNQYVKSTQSLKTTSQITGNTLDEATNTNTKSHAPNNSSSSNSLPQSSSLKCSKVLLDEILTQMNYNDLKKQQINQSKSQIWSSLMNSCMRSSTDPQTHVASLCKEHKIVF